MADIYGYARQRGEGQMSQLVLRNTDGSIECGSRFKYIDNEITLGYQNLVDTIQKAIDKEAAELGGKFVTDERVVAPIAVTYDYDALMKEFSTIAGQLMERDSAVNQPKITAIVDKYLGKGKKISEAKPDQAEFIHLIVSEIKETLL
jgi:hypothetical protein